MSLPKVLRELQSVHDNLAVIHRDLGNYPPEMAALDTELKGVHKRLAEIARSTEALGIKRQEMSKGLSLAQKLEDSARSSVKAAKQKVQYTAALRDLDARERERSAIARPLKEAEQRIEELEAEAGELKTRATELQAAFDAQQASFLAAHENQVVAEKRLTLRKAELEQALNPSEVSRFNRILHQRQGKALVTVEGKVCTGCRTQLRPMLLNQLKETGMVSCESCQRYLIQPADS